jgi:4-hydroxy-tetrahydrodipicolinate synthase
MPLTGTYTALITPFRNNQFDEPAFEKVVNRQVEAGIDGIVPVGTTGESPTVDMSEHSRIIELAVRYAGGKARVIAGTGANSTAEAIHLTQQAEKAGADASLQVAPYYNKPSQEGLFQHFSAIAAATSLPLVLYSIPGRCGVAIAVETVVRLAESHSNIVAIKEAGGDADRVSQLRAALPDSFDILSGDDGLTLPFMAVGARGVISVASNIIPTEVNSMVRNFREGRHAEALAIHEKYYPLFKDLFIETNPVPVKTAMALCGFCEEEFRLPLCPMAPSNRQKLVETLKSLQLLS